MEKKNFENGCLLCGAELVYKNNEVELKCSICQNKFKTLVCCKNGHYICDQCHEQPANDFIYNICLNSQITDPIQLAIQLMNDSRIHMHGPEHHFLVPAVLISCYLKRKDQGDVLSEKLKKARSRSEKILGGFCGTHGLCGAAAGTGIFMSIITQNSPLKKEEWGLSNQLTGLSLLSIAKLGGPRCCKRDVFLSLIEAVNFIEKHFQITLSQKKTITCHYYSKNKQCLYNDCPYFPKK